MAISMLKIRRPLGRLIFNMGIAIPGKTVFLIETAPWRQAIIWNNVGLLDPKEELTVNLSTSTKIFIAKCTSKYHLQNGDHNVSTSMF